MYNVFSIADYASLHVWTVTLCIWRAWSVLNFFVFNSRSLTGSLIQFTGKGYEQVAVIKMLFPTIHSIVAQEPCCIISTVKIMPAVRTGVALAAAES